MTQNIRFARLPFSALVVAAMGIYCARFDGLTIPDSEDASKGIELFDMQTDPQQYTNLAQVNEYLPLVSQSKVKMTEKLKAVRANDL